MEKLVASIEINLAHIRTVLSADDMIRYREFRCGEAAACILFVEGMINQDVVNESVLRPLMENRPPFIGPAVVRLLCEKHLYNNDPRVDSRFEVLFKNLLMGDTILLVDGDPQFAYLSTKGFEHRGVTEPTGELTIRGPREGFTEVFNTNLSLIRRKLPTTDLKYRVFPLGSETTTRVCVCYMEGTAKPEVVQRILERVESLQMESMLDANYILETLSEPRHGLFKTIGTSERPDRIAASLLEGRVAIVVDGTPSVLWAPFLFVEYFHTHDDYYVNAPYVTFARILRMLGFLCGVSIPALYLALISYHQEIIPSSLLVSILASRRPVPFPAIVEALLLLFAFELLREAGIHSPSNISQSLSIVGGIVLGQSAVEAQLVSAPMVIIVALTGVCGLMLPQMKGIIPITRLALLAFSTLLGLLGYVVGMLLLLLYLSSMSSCGVPYLHGLLPGDRGALQDGIYRASWRSMGRRRMPLPGQIPEEEEE